MGRRKKKIDRNADLDTKAQHGKRLVLIFWVG
jgi:hypothetical protein